MMEFLKFGGRERGLEIFGGYGDNIRTGFGLTQNY